MRVRVLGPVRAWHDEGGPVDLGPVGQRAVLGLLALNGGRQVSRAHLIDALWGRRPPPSAVNIVQTRIKHLRRLLEPGRQPRSGSEILPRVGDGYALRAATDVTCFRVLAASSDAATVRQALELWHGTALADIPMLVEHPSILAITRERQSAVVRYGEMMIAHGAAADVVPLLEEAAATQPLDETVQARLIRAYHAAGRRAKAFALFHVVRRRLAAELGVAPGPELVSANEDMLRGHADVPVSDHPVPRMLPADVPGFTGRAAELSELDDQLRPGTSMPICVLHGTAGAGKSALAVHACHRVRHRFPDGQLYIDLRGHSPSRPMTAREALGGALRALGVPAREISWDVADRAARLRTALADSRTLVVLDNARSAGQVRPLLPGSPSCAVVVTSRDSMASLVALHGAHRIGLDPVRADPVRS